jgi:hypothetical protein
MPITFERLAPRLYYTRFEGQYSDEEMLNSARHRLAEIETNADTNAIAIAEIIGTYHPPQSITTSRLMAQELTSLKLQIVVGLPKKRQILSEIQFRSMGLDHKLAFFDTVEEAVAYAKALLAAENIEPKV